MIQLSGTEQVLCTDGYSLLCIDKVSLSDTQKKDAIWFFEAAHNQRFYIFASRSFTLKYLSLSCKKKSDKYIHILTARKGSTGQ